VQALGGAEVNAVAWARLGSGAASVSECALRRRAASARAGASRAARRSSAARPGSTGPAATWRSNYAERRHASACMSEL
jgi:hypothetical protein